MGRLNGKVAIITGAASGQGAVEAKLFAKEGAKVVATDINEQALQNVISDIEAAGGEAIAIKHNVVNEEEWANVITKAVEAFGKIDVLVNNAGIAPSTPLEQTSLDDWHKAMDINMTSVFLGTKLVVPAMRKAGGGSIINISSMAGLVGTGAANAYPASKGAVRIFTKASAVEFSKENIRVNSVHPGVIETPMTKDVLANEEWSAGLKAATLIPRWGKSEDVAYGVLYLASDESSFVTGSELVIDGGYTAH
ncbi:SDR family NAD(P)-dependent oxidoreductase [Heyndrickxia vini]|uniref:Glucose 1-dehydrogenase n=1 Tax=Heyndrickxia vini TaxID=1476025 RepID=A0ABX7E2Y6_9BACI|nr:glucose 1-dehydrogenase [Heyndrickxia vini]QQZ10083.1 glucose 1-dehydrogenase [Heyndrickxia vini]